MFPKDLFHSFRFSVMIELIKIIINKRKKSDKNITVNNIKKSTK